ncbi:hypothetical protein BJ875DRAFT_490007 [Amylocarpus encephaloides]|uniref:Uncharacterized protein n=1 Tax=Amylocarpus encephaloides TaxID=45428 RepID=A0A9P7Y8B1_9HELO|nr:hypothetical protein BJ875DRAFT_490007 [Amylocarpus encephaloides]
MSQDLPVTCVKSKADYSILEVDLTAINDSNPPRNTASDSTNSNGLGSGTTPSSKLFVANHKDDDNDRGIIGGARLQPAMDLSTSASPTETTLGSASCVGLGVIREAEKDSTSTPSTERLDLFAVSSNKIDSDHNVSAPE